MSALKTDPAARNFIQAMRRRAIAYFCQCDETALTLIRRDPSTATGRPQRAGVSESLHQGILRCWAEFGPVTADGVQTYRTSFTLDGAPISLLDAERVAMGEKLGDAA